jgi:hypothetical protein
MRRLVGFGVTAVLLQPLFFVIFRLMVFNTVPHDDYAPFLLWLDGMPGGQFPASPYCYRILSMVAALPFLHALPTLSVTNLPAGLPEPYLRATGALAALSYCAMIGGAVLAFGLARRTADRVAGLFAAGLFVLFCWSTQITAIDTLALLFVMAGLTLIGRPVWFAALLLASVAVNEKIALVLAVWLTLRCLTSATDRRLLWPYWMSAAGSMVLYAACVALLHFPGNEYQQNPASFLVTLRDNIGAYGSVRGLLLNVLPAVILAAVAVASHLRGHALFRPADLLVIPAMLAVAVVLTQFFQAGRIVMHAAPIFVVPAGIALAGWARGVTGPVPPRAPAVRATNPRRTRG